MIIITNKNNTTGETNSKYEYYNYDYFGNVLRYEFSQIISGSETTVYLETHEYDTTANRLDTGKYWLEKKATYKKNDSETITVTNTLSSDHRLVENTAVKRGDVQEAYSEYTYNMYSAKPKHNEKNSIKFSKRI